MDKGSPILIDSRTKRDTALLHDCSTAVLQLCNTEDGINILPAKERKRKETPSALAQAAPSLIKSKRLRAPPPTLPVIPVLPGSPVLELVTPEPLPSHSTVVHASHYLAGHFASADDGSPRRSRALVSALSDVLQSICDLNSCTRGVCGGGGGGVSMHLYHSPQFPDGSASIFYSLEVPRIALRDYIARIVRYLQVSRSVFVAALVLLDRAHAADDALALTHLNVHRLLITALGIATKFLEDESYRNSTVGRIGGIPSTVEINLLEAQFLRRIRWNCAVSPEKFELYERNVFGFTADLAPR